MERGAAGAAPVPVVSSPRSFALLSPKVNVGGGGDNITISVVVIEQSGLTGFPRLLISTRVLLRSETALHPDFHVCTALHLVRSVQEPLHTKDVAGRQRRVHTFCCFISAGDDTDTSFCYGHINWPVYLALADPPARPLLLHRWGFCLNKIHCFTSARDFRESGGI